MSLGQREFGNTFIKDIKKEMSNKHIEIQRYDNSKIVVQEYLIAGNGIQPLTPISYQPAKIKFSAGRCMVVSAENDAELYDCRYDDCIIKRL